jgi:hypothetical protein
MVSLNTEMNSDLESLTTFRRNIPPPSSGQYKAEGQHPQVAFRSQLRICETTRSARQWARNCQLQTEEETTGHFRSETHTKRLSQEECVSCNRTKTCSFAEHFSKRHVSNDPFLWLAKRCANTDSGQACVWVEGKGCAGSVRCDTNLLL